MKKLSSTFLFLLLTGLLSAQNTVCFNVIPNPDISQPAFASFTKYVNVYGIKLYGEPGITDVKILHGAAILAELLDNNEDGIVDDQLLLTTLLSRDALMPFIMSFSSPALTAFNNNYTGTGLVDILVDNEIHPEGSSQAGGFDATLEEMMHLIHSAGHAYTYPTIFDNTNANSQLRQAMAIASTGGWYIYGSGNPIGINAQEYIYWGLSTKMGAQNYTGRCIEIANEWTLCTAVQFQIGDTVLYNLLNNSLYKMPVNMPDGNYCPATTGIESVNTNSSFNIYPNPSNGIVTISQEKESAISVFNSLGVLVEFIKNPTKQITLDLSVQKAGIYFIKTNSGLVKKIILLD
jgi:hypothetical protein